MFEKLNKQLYENNEENMFVTSWMGILEIDTGKFTFVNVGHTPPILKINENYTWLKSKPCFVLGGIEDIKYSQNEIFLAPGNRILLYTDGITETINNVDETFGKEHLIESLIEEDNLEIFEILNSIKNKINSFVGDLDQFDDITILILEYKKMKL